MTRLAKVLLFILILILSTVSSEGANESAEGQAIGVLLKRYETIVGLRSKVLSRLHLDDSREDFGQKVLGLPFVYFMGGLNAVGPGTLQAVEAGSDTVVAGAKEFVRPSGLGMVSSRTCYIAVLTSGAAKDLTFEFTKVKSTVVDGRPIWRWSVPPSEGYKEDHTFYATIVRRVFFVLASDIENMREVASALDVQTAEGNLAGDNDLASLRAHKYWARRTIQRGDLVDPSAAGLSALPASASRLDLFTDFENHELFFKILASEDQSSIQPSDLPQLDSTRFQQLNPGEWQATIPLAAPETTSVLFRVLSYFGYGVSL